LESYAWPGNVRELQSAVRYAYIQSAGEIITADSLPDHLRGENGALRAESIPAKIGAPEPEHRELDVAALVADLLRARESEIYEKVCAAVDRTVIETVLRHVKGNQLRASEILGISRTTLRAKLRALGLAIEKQLLSESSRFD
jgi:two-component system nitrogen regulation response regulator GlnG